MMWLNKFLFAALFLMTSGLTIDPQVVSVEEFSDELYRWATTQEESEQFKNFVQNLRIPTEFHQTDWKFFTNRLDSSICTICQATVKTFLQLRREGMVEETIRSSVTKLCTLLNIQSETVCKGAIELQLPIAIYIMDSKPNLSSSTVCGVVLGGSKSCPLNDPEHEWSIDLDLNEPVERAPKDEIGQPIKVLHFTDLHYDPKYEPYGNAYCDEPLCCRRSASNTFITNSTLLNANTVAGYWGDYGYCDTPWHSVVDALDHMRDAHKDVDYVYFTGDVIDHAVWETTQKGNIDILKKNYLKIYDTFQALPVYPVLGNHESHPVNVFAPSTITDEGLTTRWLYEFIADLWISTGRLPEATRSTILRGGFYTVSPKKGFRIIALNSNVCSGYNWWLLHSPRDPDDQLQWLADTLLEAERNGEYVHILSHIPPNHKDCVRSWKKEYLRILARFAYIVTAQFNGHSHKDELAVIYDAEGVPKNVAWNGGAVTTYENYNLNYKTYTVNPDNYAVIDYENWMYDLDLANMNSEVRPVWYKSYSFKTEYGVPDLSAKSLSNWLIRAANNETLLTKYYRNFFKRAEPALAVECDSRCKKEYLCRVVASTKKNDLCKNILGSY